MVSRPEGASIQQISWAEIEAAVTLLASQLARVGLEKPNVVIGITRGGLIPAALFAHKQNIKEVYCDVAINDLRLFVTPETMVLVIDDICDSGTTFKFIKEQTKHIKAKSIITAALFTKKRSRCFIDHYGVMLTSDAFLKFPWETIQSMNS